jgi:hypothetical protein
MLDKLKLFLILVLLGYLGFMGWKYLQERSGGLKHYSEEDLRSMTAEDKAKIEKDFSNLSPLQQIQAELNSITRRIFAPLEKKKSSYSVELERLWKRSQQDFISGEISEADAQILATLIRELNECASERVLYVERYQKADAMAPSPLTEGMSVEQKKAFAEKEILRQWKEWVALNQPKVQQLYDTLSE